MMAVAAIACRKIEQLPPEPRIEFRNFAVFDTTDILGNLCKAEGSHFTLKTETVIWDFRHPTELNMKHKSFP
jgi:hypothetical protein